MLEKWESLSTWIRWLLYLPAVLIPSAVLSVLFILIQEVFGRGRTGAILELFGMLLFTLLFVWLSLNLAPSRKKAAAWTMFVLLSIPHTLNVISILYTWIGVGEGYVFQAVFELLQSTVWFGTGILCLVYFGREV